MLDFGAAREFPAKFTDPYLKLLKAGFSFFIRITTKIKKTHNK
jgi:hypothetical protein